MNTKDRFMTIKLDGQLRRRVVALAKKERRSIADQAAYLMEKGFLTLENTSRNREPAEEETA
jgi:predicted transcriptional regulator